MIFRYFIIKEPKRTFFEINLIGVDSLKEYQSFLEEFILIDFE